MKENGTLVVTDTCAIWPPGLGHTATAPVTGWAGKGAHSLLVYPWQAKSSGEVSSVRPRGVVASHRVLCTKSHTVKGCLCLTVNKRVTRRRWGIEVVRKQRMERPPALCWQPVLSAKRLASLHGENASGCLQLPPSPTASQELAKGSRVDACEA